MKDNLLCCGCKRCENRATREPPVSNQHRDKIQSRLKSKSIGGHFGVKVKHCMCRVLVLSPSAVRFLNCSYIQLYTHLQATQQQLISPPPDQ